MSGLPLRPAADAEPADIARNMLSAVTYLAAVATTAGFVRVAKSLSAIKPELQRIAKSSSLQPSTGERQ